MKESKRRDAEKGPDVKLLVEERQRYVGWLEALEAKRDATPAHVYQRVHDDYTERLRRVDQQLAKSRRTIEEERSTLESRFSLLEAEEKMRADERAELELRKEVGEMSGKDADDALRSLDEALVKLSREKAGLKAKLDALDTLVKTTPSLAGEPVAPAAPSPPREPTPARPREDEAKPTTEGHDFDELAFLSSVVGQDTAHAADSGVTPKPVAPEPRPQAEAERPERAPERGPAQPQREIFAANDTTNGAESLRPARASRQVEVSASEELLEQASERSSTGEAPLAANVASNNPIVLKSATPGDQTAKTLKCNECGAMNYPTEWYCERCGGELAAL